MNRSIASALVAIVVCTLGLSGCHGGHHPAYSPGIKYGLRKDPIVRVAKELGDERYDPEHPGLLPLMKLADMQNLDHPYHAKSQNLDDKFLRDPTKVPEKLRKELEEALEKMFGTPASPIVNAKEAEIDEKKLAELKLDAETLATGSRHYRVHCLHCHGVPGDGRGPTARWINPHPRDFRGGMFKFQSVDRTANTGRPPARADLLRTLRNGIEGTAMPSFALLKDEELEALISYVIHLSVRGNVERTTIVYAFSGFDPKKDELIWNPDEGTMTENVKGYTKQFVTGKAGAEKTEGWLASTKSPLTAINVKPFPFGENDPKFWTEYLPASVKRGQIIFNSTPTPEFKKHFLDSALPKALVEAKKLALAKAFTDAEAKAIEDAEAKLIATAEAKAKADKKELTDAEKDKIREELQKDHDKIKAGVKKDKIKIEQDVDKGEPMLKQQLEKDLLAKADAIAGVKCVTCHIDYGRQAKYKWDEWGTLVRPNNLTLGVYRGGKRPVDIYYRIHSGIPGSEMNPFGATFAGHEEYLWDVVNFVSVLPYPAMRDKLGIKID